MASRRPLLALDCTGCTRHQPLGQRLVFVDESALDFPTIYVSAGRRGLQIELPPQDVVSLCGGSTVRLLR